MKLEYIKPHQILALNRGEASKILTVKVVIPEWFYNKFERYYKNVPNINNQAPFL